jgi:hypothetical protein
MALITRTGTDFFDPGEVLLQKLEKRIDFAVNALAREHHLRNTEEPVLTARLVQLIEDNLRHDPIVVPGLKLEWESQTMGSIGRREEANSGADVYLSIVRRDAGRRDSKGMLVQAKRKKRFNKKSERDRLTIQCNKMRDRTQDAYVWIFHETGVRVVKAPKDATDIQITDLLDSASVTPGELVAEGLRCNRGDRTIGRSLNMELHAAMNDITSRLGAKRWVQYTIK